MAPHPRLIVLAALALGLAGCTPPVPPPPSTPAPSVSATASTPAATPPPADAAEALARQKPAHTPVDFDLDDAETLWLNRGENTIGQGGTYRLRGSVSGNLVVDAGDEDVVLVLDGLRLRSPDGPGVEVESAGQVVVVANPDSANSIESGAAGITSSADLTLTGTGSLDIDSGGDGIRGRAGVEVSEGSLRVSAAGDGIRAAGHLVVGAGTITIAAEGVGMRSDGTDDGGGYVAVSDPFLTIHSGSDAVRAAGDLIVFGGALDLATADGHEARIGDDDDATALKAGGHIVVDDGTFGLDTADDGVNAGDTVVINGGNWEIAAGDDAIHGDLRLTITDGRIAITTATEGIEAETITVEGGTISVVATDDAMNASEADEPLATPSITLSGGALQLDSAAGDGLDANGDVTMTGGNLVILGATVENESAIDFDGTFLISGGTLAAAGGSGMAQPPSGDSAQRSLWFDVAGREGTVVEFAGPDGAVVASFTGTREFGTVVVSGPGIAAGVTHTVTADGKQVGTTTTADADNAPRRFPGRR